MMGGVHYNDHTLKPWPSGLIIMWYGDAAAIPSGWILCNGNNGTPDMRDRFAIGAGGTLTVGARLGAATTSHNHEISATSSSPLSLNQHRHDQLIQNFLVGGPSHKHPFSTIAGATVVNNLPPFMVLAFLMKTYVAVPATYRKHWNEGNMTPANRRFPNGTILPWSYSIDSIPSGWALCNGSNSTPDLRDRFIMGHGSKSVGATGGSLTENHAHPVSGNTGKSADTRAYNPGFSTEYFGGPDHVHPVNGSTANAILDHTPPYYALALMMKVVA